MLRTIKFAGLPISLAFSSLMLLTIPSVHAQPVGVNLNIGIGLMLPLTMAYVPPPPPQPITVIYPAVVQPPMPVIVYPVMQQPKPVHFAPPHKPRHH